MPIAENRIIPRFVGFHRICEKNQMKFKSPPPDRNIHRSEFSRTKVIQPTTGLLMPFVGCIYFLSCKDWITFQKYICTPDSEAEKYRIEDNFHTVWVQRHAACDCITESIFSVMHNEPAWLSGYIRLLYALEYVMNIPVNTYRPIRDLIGSIRLTVVYAGIYRFRIIRCHFPEREFYNAGRIHSNTEFKK